MKQKQIPKAAQLRQCLLAAGALAFAAALAGAPAFAADAGSAAAVAPPQTLEEAKAMRDRADAMRAEAERNYAIAQNACYAKFLVNACLNDAKKEFTRAGLEARPLEQMARDFEREDRRSKSEAKEAQRALDAEQRVRDEAAQAASYRAEEARRAAAREQHLADKAAEAEAGRRKTAAEEAQRRENDAERARHQADRDARKARKAAGE